ncbi:hypothetical protein DSO57_1010664 [Entomophthora muscae]|uniref:Uncharacterized protein n=1 Tax=Entomophthora muscae TaxID=34485 RepID=A0ACC2RXL7_9FUNG|nr:hypothetical protein DSO57_1010664 [Entomophthora muscae]
MDFPPLLGKNKIKLRGNQNLVGAKLIYHPGRRPLPPRRRPPAPSQPPASPLPASQLPTQAGASPQPTHLLPGPQLGACHPPGSQGPPCNQSKISLGYSQSKKSLATGKNSEEKVPPPEEGKNKILDSKNKHVTNQSGANSLATWTRPNPIQNNDLGTKITSDKELTHNLHLAPGQQGTIGLSQEFPNQPQITGEQEFDHLPKFQLLAISSKLLGSLIPCFSLPITNLCTRGRTINKGSHLMKFNLQLKLKLPISPCQPSNPRKMNHLIFTAVLTACLGIGGYQQGSEFFGPSPDGLGHDPYYDPGQLNSSQTESWPPLVSPHSTLSIAMYTFMYYILTYFAGSFGRYNVHAKVSRWLMTVYPIVTALTGFRFINLLPYILQVVPTVTGYYSGGHCPQKTWPKLPLKTMGQPPKTGSLTYGHRTAPPPIKIGSFTEHEVEAILGHKL